MSNSKYYILDTSVILDDANNILRLYDNGNNTVIITDVVLSELNNRKEDARTEAGFRAREFFRFSDNDDGCKVELDDIAFPKTLRKNSINHDDDYYKMIIQYPQSESVEAQDLSVPLYVIQRNDYETTKKYTEKHGLNDAKIGEIAKAYDLTLVTNDIAFKISASIANIPAQTLQHEKVNNPDDISFEQNIQYQVDESYPSSTDYCNFTQITLTELDNSTQKEVYETGIQQHAFSMNRSLEILNFDDRFGEHFNPNLIRPINLEQKFFFSMLTHPLSNITVATGATGSGKTLIALQAGLEMVNDGIVEGIVYARNTVTANDQHSELGFRKGDEGEKLGYFMYPLYSAINFTIEHMKNNSFDPNVEYSGDTNSVKKESATALFMEHNAIEVMDIAHLRGTTISKKFVIIDETQNMTNATLKLIGTRMGEGTKLAILGDTHQIDHPFLSKRRNALVSLLKKAEKDDFVAGIQLHHTIRSQTADWFDKNF